MGSNEFTCCHLLLTVSSSDTLYNCSKLLWRTKLAWDGLASSIEYALVHVAKLSHQPHRREPLELFHKLQTTAIRAELGLRGEYTCSAFRRCSVLPPI